jgi:hypothetical protein
VKWYRKGYFEYRYKEGYKDDKGITSNFARDKTTRESDSRSPRVDVKLKRQHCPKYIESG